MKLPDGEHLLASVVNYLAQGEEYEPATVLLLCAVDVEYSEAGWTSCKHNYSSAASNI
jgi:hypothetical protein